MTRVAWRLAGRDLIGRSASAAGRSSTLWKHVWQHWKRKHKIKTGDLSLPHCLKRKVNELIDFEHCKANKLLRNTQIFKKI